MNDYLIDEDEFISIEKFRFQMQHVDGWQEISGVDADGNDTLFTRVFYRGYSVDVVDKDSVLCDFLDKNKKVKSINK